MKSYESVVVIDAEPAAVWAVLLDGPRYPEWGSGITAVDGPIVDGGKITVHAAVSPGRAFPVRVAIDRPGPMSWTGGMPLGLFRGHRTFTVTDEGLVTRLTVREEYTGLLLPLIWRSMPDLGPSFTQFTAGVKARAEGQQTPG